MAIEDEVRQDLEDEVFSEIGKTVTFISKSAPVYNSRGEQEGESTSSSSIIVVPYNIVNDRQTYQAFGNLLEGEMDVAVKYDQTVAIDDEMVIEGTNYYIKEIQENYLPGNVVTIVRLAKKHD